MGDEASALAEETARLSGLVDAARPGMGVKEVVEAYYQAINVSSMAAMLRQSESRAPGLPERLEEAREAVGRFDAETHPAISRDLDAAVSAMRGRLAKGGSPAEFEDLRRLMSTREFVGQYGRGLA